MPLPPNTLNQALDQLPQLLLTLGKLQQDRRDEELRRDIQQASQDFEVKMLSKRAAVSKELEQFRATLEPPAEPRIIEDIAGRKRFAPEVGKPGELVFPEAKPLAKAKGPSAGTISRFYASRAGFQKEIDEATERIDLMRSRLKLAPGERPVTPAWPSKGKEQTDLDNWNMWEKRLDTATGSLDSLHQKAKKEGVDLTIGAPALPTPEEVSGMSEDEILQRLAPGIK